MESASRLTDKLNFAVVGCGRYGRKRALCINKKRTALVSKVFDIDPCRAISLSKELGAVAAPSFESIYTDPDVDVVVVAVPNAFHYETCVPLIAWKKKILCEKPLSHNLVTARKLHALVEKHNVVFKCGANFRSLPVVVRMVEMVKEGTLGEIRRLSGSIGHNGEIVQGKWNCCAEIAGGGTLLDNGIHLIDLFQSLAGDFIVGDFIKKESLKSGVESYALLTYKTGTGVEILIESSWKRKDGYATVCIEGSRGRIFADVQGSVITLTRDDLSNEEIVVMESRHSLDIEMDYFIRCIQENIPPEPSAKTGLRNLEKVFMAYGEN